VARTPQLDPALPPEDVRDQLEPAVRKLIDIVATLYGGDWDSCAEDLRRRRAGQPYLYRIDIPGIDELTWLHRLKTYEVVRGEPLAATTIPAENRS
jgi:hypothetical protein